MVRRGWPRRCRRPLWRCWPALGEGFHQSLDHRYGRPNMRRCGYLPAHAELSMPIAVLGEPLQHKPLPGSPANSARAKRRRATHRASPGGCAAWRRCGRHSSDDGCAGRAEAAGFAGSAGHQGQAWIPGVFNVRMRPRLLTMTSPWILPSLHTRNLMLEPPLLPSFRKRTSSLPVEEVTLTLECTGCGVMARMAGWLRGCRSWLGSA